MKYNDFNFNKKNILITGGAGFIGSNLAFYFQKHYPDARVCVFDKFRNQEKFSNGNLKSFGHYKNLIGFNGKVIAGDINAKDDLSRLESMDWDFIFHNAAISDTRVYNQNIIMRTNVNAFTDLLELAVSKNAAMVYASSAATYGDSPSPQKVGNSENPGNPYGYSKFAMDNISRDFMKRYPGMTIVGLRYFNVYGPGEFYKDKTASTIVQFGHQILNGKAPKLFEHSDKIMRDFIFIEDVVQANILSAVTEQSGVYNVGTGISRSFQEIADLLQQNLKTTLGTKYIPNPYSSGYQDDTRADIKESMAMLGYKPNYSLEDGIAAYADEIKRLYKEEVEHV
ncbi:MAG: ADP-glyceromanno-heptose 6-epimerase [Desulfobacula sp.]|nr:ADP-glyceromanno-heptose 6-epimerase [Desulfobacula sp.]